MYLEARSIGTTEIIFAQFRFRNAKQAREAQKIDLDSSNMSDYMKEIQSRVDTPKHTTVSITQLLFTHLVTKIIP